MRRPWLAAVLWTCVGVLVPVLVMAIAINVSPWPGALLIRVVFSDNAAKVTKALEKHEPDQPVTAIRNERYRQDDGDALLDVYFPESAAESGARRPVIIWTHGGAWLSGSKDNSAQYFKILAGKGFTVVAPNYSLAPEATYPTPVRQLNAAFAYVVHNAERFHADPDNVVLAGDSAGSQLSSQMAAIVTNPDYAAEVGIEPSLTPEQLKGVVLFCGIYKMKGLTTPWQSLSKIVGWGADVTVWAYSGTRDFADPVIRQMSPFYHVTENYPPTFISGGNADPLTNVQSKPLAERLQDLGVPVGTLFYPTDHQPKLEHEYQFTLNADGEAALTAAVNFVAKQTAPK